MTFRHHPWDEMLGQRGGDGSVKHLMSPGDCNLITINFRNIMTITPTHILSGYNQRGSGGFQSQGRAHLDGSKRLVK
jgi:hypothetical protein